MCRSIQNRKQLQHIRDRKAAKQGWTCYYCEQPMWRRDPATFAARHGLTLRQAKLLQVTAEHLVPRSDGGKDSYRNVAAACRFCNIKRHKAHTILSPADYARKVRGQLRRGRWHGIRLVETAWPSSPVGPAPPLIRAPDS
jgi:5-methylcytosine-specific restriction endonuclease McrA